MTERAAKALSDTVTPAGLVAVCEIPTTGLEDVLGRRASADRRRRRNQRAGQCGHLIRIADAMGAAAVILGGHSVDPYNGKCLRASAGSIFSIPVVPAPDARAVLTALRAAGLQVLASTVDGETRLDEAGELLGRPTAWLFGPESHGLSAEIADQADHRVRIPMSGGAESLNVAAAAAICLYQSAQALAVQNIVKPPFSRPLPRPAPGACRPARTSCAPATRRGRAASCAAAGNAWACPWRSRGGAMNAGASTSGASCGVRPWARR